MDLLVSIRSASEALAALDGGADIVDAKDPEAGALGAVSLRMFGDINAAVDRRTTVTAAIGDAADESTVECQARAFAAAGASMVKIGFAGIADAARVRRLIEAAVRGVAAADNGHASAVVAVAYADARTVSSASPVAIVEAAARAGARGVLLDTACKSGPGVCELMTAPQLAEWVRRVHRASLFAAIAGKLTPDHLPIVCDCGAEIAGVRGAACDGGRSGVVTSERVRSLRGRMSDATHVARPREAAQPVPFSS